ncbi:hypothetical protein BJX63DRAFT_379986 [Aspergillus granulosus]|uniref:Uncharacterized protein n=1 Tax=Aspergillus granulosus TaxID=176169 RepID=A0ABR4HYV6_9EURO
MFIGNASDTRPLTRDPVEQPVLCVGIVSSVVCFYPCCNWSLFHGLSRLVSAR